DVIQRDRPWPFAPWDPTLGALPRRAAMLPQWVGHLGRDDANLNELLRLPDQIVSHAGKLQCQIKWEQHGHRMHIAGAALPQQDADEEPLDDPVCRLEPERDAVDA